MSKNAYLTIDDSPSIDMIKKVDILYKKKIPAIFFCQGNFMEKYPDQVIYAIQKGFVIGNHSYSHPKFCDIETIQCMDEISKTDHIIDALYHKANRKRGKKYFRYPKGIKGNITYLSLKILLKQFDFKFKAIENHLKKLNYTRLDINHPKLRYPELLRLTDTDTYWTIDIREWKIRKNKNHQITDVEQFIHTNLSYKKGNEILLIHDHHETTIYFERIVDLIIVKEFKFLKIPS